MKLQLSSAARDRSIVIYPEVMIDGMDPEQISGLHKQKKNKMEYLLEMSSFYIS
jgi:hypothetical protein